MKQYSKIAGTCTTVDPGCPCAGVTYEQIIPNPCTLTNYWATGFGGSDTEIGYGIAVGACGDTYVVGTWLSLTMNFYSFSQPPVSAGSPIGTQLFGTMTKVNTNANEICYVAKLNSSGVVQWATKIEVSGTLAAAPGYGIALDSNENVYVTGTYDTDIIIYEGTLGGTAWGTLAETSPALNTTDAFLVKYNSNGQPQWATRMGGAGSSTQSTGIAIGNDQIYLTGSFSGTIDIYSYTSGGGGNTPVNTTSIGTMTPATVVDAMVVKYDTSGQALWATKMGGTNTDYGLKIAADSNGNAYVTGFYQSNPITFYDAGTTPFGTGSTLPTIANANPGSQQAFVVKYNASGVGQWATRMGGLGQYAGQGIAVDGSGNVYITGVFNQTIRLYDAPGTLFGTNTMSNTSVGVPYDAFIVKYDANGAVVWGTKIGGVTGAEENGQSISVDANGNVYVTGDYLSSTATVFSAPLGSITSFTLANQGNRDAFLVKYNSSGVAQWATAMGGSNEDRGFAITLDSLANAYVTGFYGSNPITFYNAPSAGSPYGTLANIGSRDTFIVKYNTSGQIV